MEQERGNMNTKYLIEYGVSSQTAWNSAVVISKAKTFYDVLKENGLNVVKWEQVSQCETFLEIDSENLPTGLVFQLIRSEPTNEEEAGEICT